MLQILAFLIIATVVVSASPARVLAQRAPNGSALQVTIKGQIDGRIADQATRILSNGGSLLLVDVPGGDARAILNLAEFVIRRKIPVTVSGYCMSGCASTLFPASPNATLMPGALLGFHNTMSSNERVAQLQGLQPIAAQYAPFASRERALYRTLGLDETWLVLPEVYTQPVCFNYADPNSAAGFFVYLQYNLYLPREEELRAVGYRYKGELPEDAARAEEELNRRTGKHYTWAPRLPPRSRVPPSSSDVDSAFARIAKCSAG